MKQIQILMGIFVGMLVAALAVPSSDEAQTDQSAPNVTALEPQNEADIAKRDADNKPDLTSADDPELVKAVEEALVAFKKQSPQVQEDSLRAWKNFKSTSKPINYTYRFWGRQLIAWLKEEKKMVFMSETDVGKVFKILYHKELISANAVVVLMVDAWGHLVYLEGSPDWEKREENRVGGGEVAPDDTNAKKPNTPV